MKRFVLFILFLILYLQAGWAVDNIRIKESIGFFSKILNQEVKYSICLPEDYYSSKNTYPVVYLLHGLGDDESSWLEYGRISQAADKDVKNGDIIPMIFIMPQGYRNYYLNDYAGTFLYQDMFVMELVPLIDSLYRTIPDRFHRALMGYSMGGFGAFILPLKNPEVFCVSVPLSISIRTDGQYMVEDASEWDQQWGRLFGGVGKTGPERITDYYKANCPFHIIQNSDPELYKDLKLYIDNGDDEQTLCRSNEELHILMQDRKFPHEFRVRDGGHEFIYWREALPNALRFISDAFEGKVYRGDILSSYSHVNKERIEIIEKNAYSIILPGEFNVTSRRYPVIYFTGDFSYQEKEEIAGMINTCTQEGSLPPNIIIFLKESNKDDILQSVITESENQYRARKGYRFRAIIAFGNSGNEILKLSLGSILFTSCAIFDAKVDFITAERILKEMDKEKSGRTWYYIAAPDNGINYTENGYLHILLRDLKIYHEYRVSEGNGGYKWFLSGLFDSLNFTQGKIHN